MKLKYKIALFSILISGLGILSISIFSERFISKVTFEEFQSESENNITNFIERNRDNILNKQEGTLLRELYVLLLKVDGQYGMVLSPDGTVIAHTDINQVGKRKDDFIKQFNTTSSEFFVIQDPKKPDLLDISTKVKSKASGQLDPEDFLLGNAGEEETEMDIGVVRVGMSTKAINQYLKSIRRGMILISIICIGVTLIVSFVFTYFMTRPLGVLMTGIDQIRSGNMNAQVEIPSQDELGEVGQAFNKMVANLVTAESELLNTNKELQNKLDDLARAKYDLENAQDKLIRTEKLAAVGQLASSVGHELRNPLAAINNAIYFIKNSLSGSSLAKEEPEIEEMIKVTEQEIQSSTNIIADLLNYARVVRLQPQNTDLNILIESTIKSMEIPERVTISRDFEEKLPIVSCDPQKMRQVFTNVITNSIQAITGKGTITISTRVHQDNGSWIYMAFKDTGEGISNENIKKIFEPLFTTKAKGTGLGLAICHGYVDKHGGRIAVESAKGEGATFTIILPLVIKVDS